MRDPRRNSAYHVKLQAVQQCSKFKLEEVLANTKSAMKRNRQNEKRRIQNRYYRGRARTFVKQARTAIDEGNAEAARERTMVAISALDKAAAKGVIHDNNAARRKSRLMRDLNLLEQNKG